MIPVMFGCIDIGNSKDLSMNFFDYLNLSDLVVVENQYIWDDFCEKNKIIYEKEVVSFNLPGLKGKFLNELPKEDRQLFYDNQNFVLDRVSELYQLGKRVLILSDEGSSIVADSGEAIRKYCLKNGIGYSVMAGPSAVINSLSISGFEDLNQPFVFYGPVFSLEYLDYFLNKVDSSPNNFIGIAFLTPKTASHVVESMMHRFGNIESYLCINLTMSSERVLGNNLNDIIDYLRDMGEDYHLLKEKISIVFKKETQN